MAQLHKSVATLRIFGDSLVPDEISKSLGCKPTRSEFKGEIIRGQKTGRERTARTGSWRLEATDQQPENLDGQVVELLSRLTDDLEVWASICNRFKVDLFCGLFMNENNEGLGLAPSTLAALGNRGIELSLDIYGPDQETEKQQA